ncbi:hypothetical protein GE09DRAFT_949153 [Coniochaeta sp. 2T2.1]|nr:hypothetical protein GE09DRAFT_949153 [Coniochaeta sp. 2T2.1]
MCSETYSSHLEYTCTRQLSLHSVVSAQSPEPWLKVRVDETSAGLLNLLRTLSQDEAFDLLQRLRAGSEPFSLFPATSERLSLEHPEQYRRVRTPDSTSHHISESRLATNATGIELELMMRYPVAYPCLCPVDVEPALFESLPTLPLPTPGSPTPERSLTGARQVANRLIPTKHAATYVTNQCYSSSTGPIGSPEVHMSGDGTETANDSMHSQSSQRYCDARLSRTDFRKWTSVQVENRLAAGAVSYYLETDHPIHGLFDEDLFLTDLNSGQQSFCSAVLVNAVLGWACQSYSTIEPVAAQYQSAFYDEGTRLWQGAEHPNTLTGVAAAHLLSMTAICQGNDAAAEHRLQEAFAMGCRMGLYGAVEEKSAITWLDNHHSWIRAASHTAWGGYCSATHYSLHYQTALLERPPFLPIPGEVGAKGDRSKGDRYESYPMSSKIGQTFNKLCELFRIAHRILWEYYDGEGQSEDTPVKRVNLGFAEEIFREQLSWSASLPLHLVRSDGNSHHVVLLHTYFHCLVLDIFRPFLDRASALPLTTFEADKDNGAVGIVYNASVNQLKRLVLLYLSKFGHGATSALWRPALIYVLNSLIRDARLSSERKRTSEWDFYFKTCMLGLAKQLPCFPITDRVIQGILSMAVRDGIMSTSEASKMLEDMRREAGTEGWPSYTGVSSSCTSFIVDLDLATKHPSKATVDVLVNELDRLAMLADAASSAS